MKPQGRAVSLLRPRPDARLRLFCFPYAGAGATAFHAWADELPLWVELCPVQLPGRGHRMNERPHTRMAPLVDALRGELEPELTLPFAFFGHSMGALVAFELVRALRRANQPLPVRFFPSGRNAPQVPETRPRLHALPDERVVEELRRLGGTPPEVLDDPELLELILPTLRADLEAAETYVYSPEPPLDIPITALGGNTDALVAHAALEAWSEQTTASCTTRFYEGGHFFLQDARSLLLRTLSRELEQANVCTR